MLSVTGRNTEAYAYDDWLQQFSRVRVQLVL